MARYWSTKDGNGNELTDGRVCLVIESEDKTMPAIRTYGRDKDEVLDKLARTTETAQTEIHKLRNGARPASTSPTTTATLAPSGRLTADETARATADLSNPAKSGEAIKTLLRDQGFDVDKNRLDQASRRVAAIGEEWEKQNPDFPHDDRNQRLLIQTAALKVGFVNITAAALDAAYQELLDHEMLFDVEKPAVTVPPGGTPEPRTVRNATSYQRRNVSGSAPRVEAPKPKYTREQVDAMNSRELRNKIENEPGFKELVDQYHNTPVRRTA
jgi:hypothetical protein